MAEAPMAETADDGRERHREQRAAMPAGRGLPRVRGVGRQDAHLVSTAEPRMAGAIAISHERRQCLRTHREVGGATTGRRQRTGRQRLTSSDRGGVAARPG